MRDPSRDHSNPCFPQGASVTGNTAVFPEAASATHNSAPTRKATCRPLGDHLGHGICPGSAGRVTRMIGGDGSPWLFTLTTTTARFETGHTPRKVVTGPEARDSPYASLVPSGENRGQAWATPSPSKPMMRRAAAPSLTR